jgi:hypothetical protein
MVAMVGCRKDANDPRVRVRTRARVFKYPSDHVDHVTPSVSSLSSISYTPTWSGTWSAHGGLIGIQAVFLGSLLGCKLCGDDD